MVCEERGFALPVNSVWAENICVRRRREGVQGADEIMPRIVEVVHVRTCAARRKMQKGDEMVFFASRGHCSCQPPPPPPQLGLRGRPRSNVSLPRDNTRFATTSRNIYRTLPIFYICEMVDTLELSSGGWENKDDVQSQHSQPSRIA